MKNKEFISAFQITRMIIFKVSYYTLGNNKNPYFTTSANVFVRNKKDYSQGGQCQDKVLPKGIAKDFFNKWDNKHLSDLTDSEYVEMMEDLQQLKDTYNNIYIEKDTFKNQNSTISFNRLKELSMMKQK